MLKLAADFSVEVPINVNGAGSPSGAGGDSKQLDDLNKGIKKLDKTMFLNVDAIEALSSIAGDLFKIIQPLFKILGLLLVVFFLPFMPIVKELVKVVGGLVKLFSGDINIVQFLLDFLIPALIGIVKALWNIFVDNMKLIFSNLAALFIAIWNDVLLPVFTFIGEMISNVAIWIWDKVTGAFEALGDLSLKIWEFIKGLFKGTIDGVGVVWEFIKTLFKGTINAVSNVWDFLKNLFKGTINVASTVWNWFKSLFGGRSSGGSSKKQNDFISRPGQDPVAFSAQDTIIGVKDISALGGKNVININNPVVRNDQDIKKLANEVSRVMQRSTKGRFSQ